MERLVVWNELKWVGKGERWWGMGVREREIIGDSEVERNCSSSLLKGERVGEWI